ncbi:histidine kinase, partial [Xanthomonas sp. Kuri4-2]
GYLWLATGDGLARFDGRSYRIWRIEDGLRDNFVWSVHVDARNRVWIGTENAGLVMLTADRRRFHFYDHRGYPQLLGSTVWCIESTPDGSVWFGTSNNGLYRLRPDGGMDRFVPVKGDPRSLPATAVNLLKVDAEGDLWVGTKSGLARWTGHDFERQRLPAGVSGTVNGLTRDRDGSLWIADANGPLVR